MRLSAADALNRGLANLAANWELVLVNWLGGLLLTLLVVAGLLPVFLVLGLDLFRQAFSHMGRSEDAAQVWAELLGRWSGPSPALLLAGLGTLAVWTFASILFCYLQAGTYGVLAAGDRQAPPRVPRDRHFFRTFSLRDFFGWGGLYFGRFLRFYALYFIAVFFLALLALAWIGLAVYGAARWGGGAAFGFGCGGALPLAFLVLLLAAWLYVAQADLTREDSGALAAARRALEVIGRRLGAVILLFVLFFVALIGLGLLFGLLSIAVNLGMQDQPIARTAVGFALSFLQSIPQIFLNVALAAALVALVRSEPTRSGAAA